jgi:signal transduction histidine kinase
MGEGVSAKILVVDDLPENILVYQAMLETLGQEVVAAHSGEEALKQVLANEFAVILLDVNMPGLDGFETAALIRKRRRSAHTPIIFITAFADELRTNQGYAHGAVDFILSPVVPQILQAKVRVFVELFRMSEEVRRHAEERIALAEERSRREAAEEANRRLGFLAHAGGVIGQSLDAVATARDVLRLVVPRLADRALLVHREEVGSPWQGIEARVESGVIVSEPLASWEKLPAVWRETIEKVAESPGASPAIDAARSPYGEPQTLILPLCGRDRTFGVLVLVCSSAERPWAGPDLTMVEALAQRCGIALDNARLYNDVQHADRQKNEFLSMLAHELRNPLAPIRSAVDVLRLRETGQPDVSWARDIIDRQVTHLVRLVDDLLDVSRITRGKIRLEPERLQVAEIVSAAVETSRPLIEAGGHKLRVALPEQPVELLGDRTRLAQVLANLLNNSAKYTPPGGSIELESGIEEGELSIRIRDSGVGIPPDMLLKVFDLFTQVERGLDRSQGGLGIGLTLVRKLVEMHGGSVGVTSAGTGKGSEFTVRLPLLAGHAHSARPTPAARCASGESRTLRVLIVDDNADAANTLSKYFQLSGHDTRVVYDGLEAMSAAHEFLPSAIILDLGLPGIDGLSLARELRKQPATSAVPLIAVSGYGQSEHLHSTREMGFDCHFAKPVEASLLLGELLRLSSAATSV